MVLRHLPILLIIHGALQATGYANNNPNLRPAAPAIYRPTPGFDYHPGMVLQQSRFDFGTINPISLLLGGNQSPCFSGNSFLPCNCESELDSMGLVTRKITCPSGSSTSQVKNAFARIPIQGKRIGKVILNFSGSTSIPDNILGQHSVDSVQLIGTSSANTISINQAAFTASALTLVNLVIQNFDVVNVDYSFLNNFNSLSSVQINQCSNAPSFTKLPTNLSQKLPKLSNFLVDNTNIYPACPYRGILLPCACDGQTIGTVTCPLSTSVYQIQNAFSLIPPKTNIGPLVFNFEANTVTSIPSNFLSNIPSNSITLIGPSTATKSRLQINTDAFKASAPTAKTLTIENFDVGQVNYGFLKGFNVLTTIDINKCTSTPTGNPATLPTNLPALTAIKVDGMNIYTKPLIVECEDGIIIKRTIDKSNFTRLIL